MVTSALTAVNLALKSRPDVAVLGHVGTLISSYLDGSGTISLVRACEFGSIPLLDRIWESSDPAADKNSSWSLFWYLRRDIHYYRYQFTESLRTAVERGDLEIICWILDRFSECTTDVEVVEAAARCGHLEVLRHLLHYDNQEAKRNIIVWGNKDVANAIEGGHRQVARWLFENTPGADRDLSRIMEIAVRLGDFTLVQWLLDDVCRSELHLPPPAMNDAAAGGHMDILRWIFEQGYNGGSGRALEEAAKNGRLDMVEWLVGKSITKGAREALHAACGGGHITIVRLLLERKLVQCPHFAMNCAIHAGHLDVVQYLFEVGIDCRPSEMMTTAAARGHLHVVKWLVEKFEETASLFPAIKPSCVGWFNNTAMDRAATNGHMHVLQFLYSLAVKMQTEGKTEVPTLSQCALSGAATMGHFEVIKWIRDNYPQLTFVPPTTSMVARNGNLEMLQWLHQQPNIDWSTDAMDSAAENGHLAVVKWLHESRSEGCTSAAMDYAARNGHFNVVRWLHHNCLVEVTSAAMDFAVSGGYFELLLFLRDKCEVECTPTAQFFAREQRQPHILEWLKTVS